MSASSKLSLDLNDLKWAAPDFAYPYAPSICSKSSAHRLCLAEKVVIPVERSPRPRQTDDLQQDRQDHYVRSGREDEHTSSLIRPVYEAVNEGMDNGMDNGVNEAVDGGTDDVTDDDTAIDTDDDANDDEDHRTSTNRKKSVDLAEPRIATSALSSLLRQMKDHLYVSQPECGHELGEEMSETMRVSLAQYRTMHNPYRSRKRAPEQDEGDGQSDAGVQEQEKVVEYRSQEQEIFLNEVAVW